VATAHELARPKIHIHLSGHGAHRRLHYTIVPEPGMQVSFEEAAKGGGQILGSAHGSHGSISFIPSGVSGQRSIIAIVTQNGEPRADITVARYTAPPPRPGRTSAIRVARTHGGLLVSFRPAPLSTSTLVAACFSEGRAVVLTAGRGKHSVFIPAIAKTSAPRGIVVTGLRGAVKGPSVGVRRP
jgi:hypothetical protein